MSDDMHEVIDKPVIVLIGPTAVGKTDCSLTVAEQCGCEVVGMDSMQVYRYMDVGTAKIPFSERRMIPHHLIDVVDPDEHYDAHRYRCDCIEVIRNIHRRSAVPLLTGGTGLYLRSLRTGFFDIGSIPAAIRSQVREEIVEKGSQVVHEEMFLYDYFSARNIHPNDTYRLARAVEVYRATGRPISEHQRAQKAQQSFANMLVVGLTCERDELYKRINLRTTVMIEGGLEEEVTGLLDKGYSPELKPMQSIGYRHMINYLKGKDTLDEMRELLARDTRRYAKRQYTWFNRDGSIKWFDKREEKEVLSYIEFWLDHKRSSGVKGG